MHKVFALRNKDKKQIGVFYCNSLESCVELINESNFNGGIVLDDSNTKVGFITVSDYTSDLCLEETVAYIYKDSVRKVKLICDTDIFQDCVSPHNIQICGFFDDNDIIPFYIGLDTLEEVHAFLSDKDISYGFIISDGVLEYMIDEGVLINRKYI
jgi:hypothetical protein